MTVAQKKDTAKTIQELYLYPYRSKEENTIRGSVWMISWIIGIAFQPATSPKVLGSAYFIFALSLLLEFVPESKKCPWAKLIHGVFCILLVYMLLGALTLSFGPSPDTETEAQIIYSLLLKAPPYIGWTIFFMLLLSVVLSLLEAHKLVYDEDAELQQETENRQKSEREQFLCNLEGPSKGGNAK